MSLAFPSSSAIVPVASKTEPEGLGIGLDTASSAEQGTLDFQHLLMAHFFKKPIRLNEKTEAADQAERLSHLVMAEPEEPIDTASLVQAVLFPMMAADDAIPKEASSTDLSLETDKRTLGEKASDHALAVKAPIKEAGQASQDFEENTSFFKEAALLVTSETKEAGVQKVAENAFSQAFDRAKSMSLTSEEPALPKAVSTFEPISVKLESAKTAALASSITTELPKASATIAIQTQQGIEIRGERTLIHIPTPVSDQPAFLQDVGQKVIWMVRQERQSALLTLNPPQMGPIEVSLSMDKNHASAHFVSQNADVRETLEDALPRLREMLAGAGIQLGEANVSAESFQHQNEKALAQKKGEGQNGDDLLGDNTPEVLASLDEVAHTSGEGLVNLFA